MEFQETINMQLHYINFNITIKVNNQKGPLSEKDVPDLTRIAQLVEH